MKKPVLITGKQKVVGLVFFDGQVSGFAFSKLLHTQVCYLSSLLKNIFFANKMVLHPTSS